MEIMTFDYFIVRRSDNMTDKEKEAVALFRYGIIAPYVTGNLDQKPYTYFESVKDKEFTYVDGCLRKVSPTSAVRWYKTYKKEGLDGLKPKGRNDDGNYRKLDDDIRKQIEYFVSEFPRLPAVQIYDKLTANGLVIHKSPSLSTVSRYTNKLKKSKGFINITERRRYEKEHINEVWYGDSVHAMYIYDDNDGSKKKKVYIIALIDDASRMIVGIEAFFEDNFVNLMKVIKQAVSKYGVPHLLSFDNGSNYRSNQMELLAARIGVAINYNPPRTPESKAKAERWFYTLRMQFLSSRKTSDYHSLESFNLDLLKYVQKYNTTIHSSLDGLSPLDRFFKESELIIRKSDEEIERDFVLEAERKVSADSVIVINDKEYEVDYHYQNQKIIIRYTPDLKDIYVVNRKDNTLTPIKLLDKHSNASLKREKIRLTDINTEEE